MNSRTVDAVFLDYVRENGWQLTDEYLDEPAWQFQMPTWRITVTKKGGDAKVVYEWSGLRTRRQAYIRVYGAMRAHDVGFDLRPAAARSRDGRRAWHMMRSRNRNWAWCGRVLHDVERGEWAEVEGRRCKNCPRRWDREYTRLIRPILDANDPGLVDH